MSQKSQESKVKKSQRSALIWTEVVTYRGSKPQYHIACGVDNTEINLSYTLKLFVLYVTFETFRTTF